MKQIKTIENTHSSKSIVMYESIKKQFLRTCTYKTAMLSASVNTYIEPKQSSLWL